MKILYKHTNYYNPNAPRCIAKAQAFPSPRARDGSGSPPSTRPYSGVGGGGCDDRSRPRTHRRCGSRVGGYSGQPGAAPIQGA